MGPVASEDNQANAMEFWILSSDANVQQEMNERATHFVRQ